MERSRLLGLRETSQTDRLAYDILPSSLHLVGCSTFWLEFTHKACRVGRVGYGPWWHDPMTCQSPHRKSRPPRD
jgi:hypothetical protein